MYVCTCPLQHINTSKHTLSIHGHPSHILYPLLPYSPSFILYLPSLPSPPLPSPSPFCAPQMSALEVEGQALKALLEAEGKLPSFSASAGRGGLKIASQTRGMGMLETGPSRTCQLPTGSRGVGQVDEAVSDDVASCPQWCYSEASLRNTVHGCMLPSNTVVHLLGKRV